MNCIRISKEAWINPNYWYANKRGYIFEVLGESDGGFYVKNDYSQEDRIWHVFKEDVDYLIGVDLADQ